MVTLRDIMTTNLIALPPEMSLRDAMSVLSSRHISGAPVVAGGEVVGVVTATDLMAIAAELPGAPSQPVEHVEGGEWVAREENQDDGRELEPSGAFFTELWDDAGADTTSRFATPSGPEWSVLDAHTVEEAMTSAPLRSLPPETSLSVAADFMRTHAIHRVLVTRDSDVLGIVTSTDLANAIADNRLHQREYVFVDRGGHAGRSSVLADRLRRSDRPSE